MSKLIFCDIDGTIVDGSRGMLKVSDKTRYAFRELKRQGDYVVVSSGRCRALLNEDILSLEPSGFVLCNGAYAEIEGKEVHSLYFSKEAKDAIRRASMKYDGFCILESFDDVYVDSLASKTFIRFINGWGAALSGFKEETDQDENYLIAMIGFSDRETLWKAKEDLKDYVDCFDHKVTPSCDVNIKGVNKGTGVEKIIEVMNIPLEDTYCFGDGTNDIEMLECVGHPVMMANSQQELYGRGFEETGDVLDDGFYEYLVSNQLIKEM